jgi:hypothetical protein
MEVKSSFAGLPRLDQHAIAFNLQRLALDVYGLWLSCFPIIPFGPDVKKHFGKFVLLVKFFGADDAPLVCS